MEKLFKELTEDIQDLHRKTYLQSAITSHMNRLLKNYSKEEIEKFVSDKFKNMK